MKFDYFPQRSPDSRNQISLMYEAGISANLELLSVDPNNVPFDFSCGIPGLDDKHIMIDKLGIGEDGNGNNQAALCSSCHRSLYNMHALPKESLANSRWVGSVPVELQGLNWIEECLVARAHFVGRVVQLQNRRATAYFAIKGHTILLPQDTTKLLTLLPMPPESLTDLIRVVWVGKSDPNRAALSPHFKVRTKKNYDALQWLCNHHEDYKNVAITEAELNTWPSVFVATKLLDSVGRVTDASVEDASRSGFGVEESDVPTVEGNIPFTASAILDTNDVSEPQDSFALSELIRMKQTEQIITVQTGNEIISDYEEGAYFTAAFPTLFPYGTGKHIDSERCLPLQLSQWVRLALKHSSRYSL